MIDFDSSERVQSNNTMMVLIQFIIRQGISIQNNETSYFFYTLLVKHTPHRHKHTHTSFLVQSLFCRKISNRILRFA